MPAGIEIRTFFFRRIKLTRAYMAITTIPATQKSAAASVMTCSGFTLDTIFGEKLCVITGFTALLITEIPVFMAGICCIAILDGTTSLLGSRLRMLFMVTGQRSLIATRPQSTQKIHLGAFLNSRRRISTARIIHEALMLKFSIFKNKPLTFYPSSLKVSIIA